MSVSSLDNNIPTVHLVWNGTAFVDPTQLKPKPLFVKGPIPLPWLVAASKLPGKALTVGLALWHLAGMNKSQEIAVTTSALKVWGLNRYQKARALSALSLAGLVKVEKGNGRNPRVTILEVEK